MRRDVTKPLKFVLASVCKIRLPAEFRSEWIVGNRQQSVRVARYPRAIRKQ